MDFSRSGWMMVYFAAVDTIDCACDFITRCLLRGEQISAEATENAMMKAAERQLGRSAGIDGGYSLVRVDHSTHA